MSEKTALRTAEMLVWIREEQQALWHEMSEAIDGAVNGAWSMRAANIARRIVAAAKLVGPTESGSIPYPMEAGGIYRAVYAAGGIEVREPTEDEWQRYDDMMGKYGTTRATMQPKYAVTVAAIGSDRETRWINGDDA